MKKITALIMFTLMMISSVCSNAAESSYRYDPATYDEVPVDSRLSQNMPEIFSYDESVEKEQVFKLEFENDDYNTSPFNVNTKKYYIDGQVVVSRPAATKNDEQAAVYYEPAEGVPSGTYIFSCVMKMDKTSDSTTKDPTGIIIALDEQGTSFAKSSKTYNHKLDDEWTRIVKVIFVPKKAKKLRVSAYNYAATTGTFYFDDFEVFRLADDPLELVLNKPNYKGLIYGDGQADIDAVVTVGESTSYYPLEDMNLSVRLVDEDDNVYRFSDAETLSNKMNFVFSSQGLSEGDYYLQAILTDKETGDVISQKERAIRKRAQDYKPDLYLDENGRIIKNGKKSFLKRLYAGDYYDTVPAQMIDAGIDTLSAYGAWWIRKDSKRSEVLKNALKTLEENGKDQHIALTLYHTSELSETAKSVITKQEDTVPFLTLLAQDYRDEKYFAGYYLMDENEPRIYGEEIRWMNEIVAENDINHPTFGVTDQLYSNYGIFTKMVDILGTDPYPVTGKTDDNGISIDDISKAGDYVRFYKEKFPNRPVYLVLQGFHWVLRGDLRGPTEEEIKNMAWQAICEGADGLDWYSFGSMYDSADREQWLQIHKNVFADVIPYEDIILSDEPAPKYNVSGGGDWLNLTVKRYNGKTYVFAVNNTYYLKSATLSISGLDNQVLSFEPLEVKKIELSQDDFLSPEAELKTIGFSNGNETFEVSTGDYENILYVHEDSGVINYNARISDGAKLYIGREEMPLNGKITVRIAEHFTVRVVAENGKDFVSKKFRVVKE